MNFFTIVPGGVVTTGGYGPWFVAVDVGSAGRAYQLQEGDAVCAWNDGALPAVGQVLYIHGVTRADAFYFDAFTIL